MRIFCKADEKVKVKWDGVEREFEPQKITHVVNYETGQALVARNPNLVDWDVYLAERDRLASEGKMEEAKAMLIPVKASFELPHVDDPHTMWLDKATSLGMRNIGRGTPKEALIEFCRAAAGLPPGPPIPEQTIANDVERIDVLKGTSKRARAALEKMGVE